MSSSEDPFGDRLAALGVSPEEGRAQIRRMLMGMAESPFNMVALHDDEEGEEIDHYAHRRTPTYGMPVFQASGAVPGRTYTRIHAPTARARAYTRAYTRARTRAHTLKKEDPVNQRMISLHRSPGEAVRISDLESDAGRRYNGLRAVVVGDAPSRPSDGPQCSRYRVRVTSKGERHGKLLDLKSDNIRHRYCHV